MATPRLLVFARYPRAGEVKTRLVPSLDPESAMLLYRAFLLDSLEMYAMLRPSVEPVVYVAAADDVEAMRALVQDAGEDEGLSVNDAIGVREQRGAGLGERLIAAFAEAFTEGAPAACAIGTDHPTLPLAYVRDAWAALESHDLVLGPADDGGYYLIGMRAPHPGLFAAMPWSTDGLYAATVVAARSEGLSIAELPPWYDVDDAPSLLRLDADRELLAPGSRTHVMLEKLEERLAWLRGERSAGVPSELRNQSEEGE